MLHTLYRMLPRPSAGRFAVLTAWLTVAAALQGITLGFAGIVTTTVLAGDAAAANAMIALALSLVAFVTVQWRAQMLAFRSDTAEALHRRLGEHVARLPLGWLTPTRQAHVIDLATIGIPQAMSYPAILLRPAITAIVTPIAAALTLLLLDWRYTLAVLAATAIAWGVSRASDRLARRVDERHHSVSAEATRRILEYATLQPVIRTDQRRAETDALDVALDQVRTESRRAAGAVIPGLLAFSLTLNILFACMIALGVVWLAGATLTMPVFLGVIVVSARLAAVSSAGAELAAGLRLQRGVLDRLSTVLDTPPLPVFPNDDGSPGDPSDDVLLRAEDLSFTYGDASAAALEDITCAIPRRGLTAIVGASGSGKTTLVRLFARFWDPTAGTIRLDGRDVRTLSPSDLAAMLATVLQEDSLLDTSLGDNIRLGRPDASEEQLAAVVAAVGLTSFVDSLPEGLETPVGPGGSRLSGGQHQRVCVARALLKAAPLTLMDEATSALDPENAQLVSAAAHRLAETGSVVLIAHNLDLITHADQILVLDRGRLVERGTYRELASAGGALHALLIARRTGGDEPIVNRGRNQGVHNAPRQ